MCARECVCVCVYVCVCVCVGVWGVYVGGVCVVVVGVWVCGCAGVCVCVEVHDFENRYLPHTRMSMKEEPMYV